ncbi:ABC-three component system middle component 1 [Flavobacterium sp. TSSA_36]|uniref:ABC-three component system middle component 1 n=1 Tax=Flavobacterium sp. TSSA_36 TaxID=3447669 RepID=UPI0028E19932|nr:ABC-three component system middle component 1 [uncultured Flavobacterium sp.]
MKQLLYSIFEQHGIDKHPGDIDCFSYKNKSFFFNININESELFSIKNTQNFYDNKDYKNILEVYKKLVDTSGIAEIEKNSSLIITVKCEDLEALSKLQQQILLIEENEYFFKKYVILYTEESISELLKKPTIDFLQDKLNDSGKFNKYSDFGYSSDLMEYMVVIQLFIKLPFLKILFSQNEYFDLNNKLKNSLEKDSLRFDRLIKYHSDINEIDFSRVEDERKIDLILKMMSND